MPEDHQNDRRGGEVETETGERLKGPKPANLSQGKKVRSRGVPGEDRTPDQPIGEAAHMKGNDASHSEAPQAFPDRDPAKKKTGEF
jgi:hypothetical protein